MRRRRAESLNFLTLFGLDWWTSSQCRVCQEQGCHWRSQVCLGALHSPQTGGGPQHCLGRMGSGCNQPPLVCEGSCPAGGLLSHPTWSWQARSAHVPLAEEAKAEKQQFPPPDSLWRQHPGTPMCFPQHSPCKWQAAPSAHRQAGRAESTAFVLRLCTRKQGEEVLGTVWTQPSLQSEVQLALTSLCSVVMGPPASLLPARVRGGI